MNIALIKRMMDACYQAKRVRDLLPALPDGVLPSFIQYLDAIQTLEQQGTAGRHTLNILALRVLHECFR